MDQILFDPRRTSVIVIDMTNDALKPSGVYTKELGEKFFDQAELIYGNAQLIEAARATHVPVIFTRTARKSGEPRYLKHFVPPLGHRSRTYQAESLIEGSWGDEIIEELKPLTTEHVISKKRRSAFLGTPLDLILRSMDITTLVITGIGTPGCVESTVWSAFDHDYYIVIPKECTSTTNGPQDKDEALTHMGKTCAVISTLPAVISALRNPAAVPLLSLRAPGGPSSSDASPKLSRAG